MRAQADPASITFESPDYHTGSVNTQQGWVFTGSYDVSVDAQATYPAFGSQSLRMSNATTSSSFGDMPFSPSTPNDAGETTATSGGLSGGTRQSAFEAEFSFASAQPAAQQPGLRITVAPDRGDGSRMASAAIRDDLDGLAVDLQAYDPTDPDPSACNRFAAATPIASGLDRTVPHKLKLVTRFADGYFNDLVQIYVDDVLKATTPTWEEYYRFCSAEQGASANGSVAATRTVDSLLFRLSGTAAGGAVSGKGFLIDNVTLNTRPAAAASTVYVRTDGSDVTCDGSTNASAASSVEGKCAFKTVGRGVSGVDAAGTVNVGAGTFAEMVTLRGKAVTITGAGTGQTIMDGGSTLTSAFYSTTAQSNLTIQGMTIQHYAQDGINLQTGPLNTIKLEDLESLSNGRHGFTSQAFGIDGLTLNRVNFSNNTGPGGRGVWVINGAKKNVTVTNSQFNNNALVGLDLADGTLENAVITDNHVEGNGDSGMGILGTKTSASVKNNTITNNGRFGIEIKNPGGSSSGTPTLVVEQNTVTRTLAATDGPGRDYVGIGVFRRDPTTTQSSDQPIGVLIQNNVVSGYHRKAGSQGDGFGMVVAGTNMLVQNNVLDSNDIGIQIEGGNPAPDNSAVNGTDWFDRDSASSFSGTVKWNDLKSSNTLGLRAVGAVSNADVANNWWGASSRPTIASNPGATGSAAAATNGASTTYAPFLGHGTDTSADIGFQPDLATYTTRFVRTSGSNTECDGTGDADFSAALLGKCAVATGQKGADLASNGQTVQFGAGTWQGATGQINISTAKALTIQGASRATTIIDGETTPGSGVKTGGRGISFSTAGTTGATIQHLTVKNFSDHGMYGQGPITNFKVDDVESSNNGDATAPNARGVVVWNQAKDGVTITNSIFKNNGVINSPGIGIQDGSVTNLLIENNQLEGNSDAGIFVLGPTGPGANVIRGNTLLNNARFGIDIALPDGNGAESGAGSIVVENNTVSRTIAATRVEDHSGISVIRRSSYVNTENADHANGVVIRNNDVSGIRANAPGTTGQGFCIVVEGTNMAVHNNNVSNCDVGIQMQMGNTLNQQGTPAFDRGDAASYSGVVEQNNIATTNTIGLRGVGLTAAANATRNYWGSTNGPTNALNVGGNGSTVTGNNVTFSPWLKDGTDTNGAAVGFVPNLTPLGSIPNQGINVNPTSGLVTTENGGTATFQVSLGTNPSANVTIALSSSNPNEGTVSPTSLTFLPTNGTVQQTVTVTGNALAPGNGDVAYTIVTGQTVSTDPSFNGVDVPDVSVTNKAAATPSISIADATIAEGDTGLSNMTFNVTLSQSSPTTVTVNYATQNQTATAGPGADYLPANGTLTFSPGQTTKPIVVQVIGDNLVETPGESFQVNLSNASGATIADGQAIGTITDDEAAGETAACNPKPNIIVTTQSIGGHQMQVTVKAVTDAPNQANVLTTIRFGTPTNATIQMAGQATIGTTPITLPSGSRQITFTVKQTNTTAAFQVPFVINDSCGAVDKFVGGGASSLGN
jgi:hypothetical protein